MVCFHGKDPTQGPWVSKQKKSRPFFGRRARGPAPIHTPYVMAGVEVDSHRLLESAVASQSRYPCRSVAPSLRQRGGGWR